MGNIHGVANHFNVDLDATGHTQAKAETEHLEGGTHAPKAAEGVLSRNQMLANQAIFGASYHSGDPSPVSGQYVAVDSHGHQVGGEKTITKGHTFPPLSESGLSFKLIDPSRGVAAGGGKGGAVYGNPGEKAERSGQYQLVDKNGKPVAGSGETTVKAGQKFPPTPKAGEKWKLADATSTLRPGEKVEISGQYAIVGSDGKYAGEVTAQKGDKLPPTPKPGQAYRLVDETRVESPASATGHLKAGEKVKTSGQYELLGPNGEKTGKELTLTKGDVLPPTPKKGETYILKDATKHK